MAKLKTTKNPGMKLVITYTTLLVVNAVILYLANTFFPKYVVLGTHSLSPLWAILLSMGTLALMGTFAIPLVRTFEERRRKMFSNNEWMIAYFLLNFVGIWVITRYSEQFGVGIRFWYVAAMLAVVMDVIQGIAMMKLEKKMK